MRGRPDRDLRPVPARASVEVGDLGGGCEGPAAEVTVEALTVEALTVEALTVEEVRRADGTRVVTVALDLAPLLDAVGYQRGVVGSRVVAERLGVSQRQLVRWLRAGKVDVWVADRLACRAGLHPCEVWGLGPWMAALVMSPVTAACRCGATYRTLQALTRHRCAVRDVPGDARAAACPVPEPAAGVSERTGAPAQEKG